MELIASPCSWSWVKVLTSITWCPVCCRDMFHKDLSTATESAAILSTAREMMYFTKTDLKRSHFRFASPPTTESPGHDHLKQLPTPGPRAGIVPVVARVVVSSLIELCINNILKKIRSLFSLVSSNCVLPFSCCFRFLLKFSALKKFTTTGAGYGPLPRANRYAI